MVNYNNVKFRDKKPPFEACFLLTSLAILLNEQVDKCVKEFRRLNDEAIGFCKANNSKKLLECYQNMQELIYYLYLVKDHVIHNTVYKDFFTDIFNNKPKMINLALFEKYKQFFDIKNTH